MFLCKRLSTLDTMLSRFNDALQTAADVVSPIYIILRHDINRLANRAFPPMFPRRLAGTSADGIARLRIPLEAGQGLLWPGEQLFIHRRGQPKGHPGKVSSKRHSDPIPFGRDAADHYQRGIECPSATQPKCFGLCVVHSSVGSAGRLCAHR